MNKFITERAFIGRRHTFHAPVRITDLHTGESYRADCGNECHDKTDLSGYEECIQSREVITMGKIIFEPIWKD